MPLPLPRLSKEEVRCTHKWVFKGNSSYYQSTGYRGLRCVSIDEYFCENCLEQKQVKHDETFNQTQQDNLPDWAKVITRRVEPDDSYYKF